MNEAKEERDGPVCDSDDDLLDLGNDGGGEPSPSRPPLRQPLMLCRLVAARPNLAFGVALGVHVLLVATSAALMLSGYDLFPVEFSTLPLTLRHSTWLKRDNAWRGRYDYSHVVLRDLPAQNTASWPRAQRSRKSLLLLYDAGNSNIFTRDNLRTMQAIEDSLVKVPRYQDYCHFIRRGTCAPALSVLRFFDGTFSFLDPVFRDPDFNNITGVLSTAHRLNFTRGMLAYALSKGSSINASHVHVPLTRSIIPLGYPLKGMTFEQTVEAGGQFMREDFQPLLDKYLDTKQFTFLYFSEQMMIADAKDQGFQDMKLAIGSALFIFCFILFHTGSLWVTCLGVFSILCSFVETNLIYRVVIGYRYFGFFHVLAMFIILGIGADDLFVFWDAWRASEFGRFPTLAHRLDQTYRKSAISMFVTSLTTMLAFAASATSPLLATNSFGVFSATLVVIDYISVITFFPTIVVFHHIHFERKRCFSCCFSACRRAGKGRPASRTAAGDSSRDSEDLGSASDSTPLREAGSPGVQDTDEDVSLTSGDSAVNTFSYSQTVQPRPQPDHRWLVKFFRDHYLRFVTHKVWRWVVLVVLLAVAAVFAWSATRLEPDNQQVGLFKESHHYSRAFRLTFNGFVDNVVDTSVQLQLLWGVRERDMSGCHFSDYGCKGKAQMDDTFNPSTVAAQQGLMKLCKTLSNLTRQQTDDLRIRRHMLTGQPLISCFIRDLSSYLQKDSALTGSDVSLPWNRTRMLDFMTSQAAYYNASHFNQSYQYYLDVAVNYWLWDAFRQTDTDAFRTYNTLLGEQATPFSTHTLSSPHVQVGNRLRFVAVKIGTTLHYETLSYVEHIPVVERWEAFMQNQLSSMPPEMKGGFQITEVAWHWLFVQKSLVDNAIQGLVLGVSLALPILMLSTCNVLNGLLATLTICCITVCVIGVVPMAGWKLGVLVSLNMCLVVGLAVDYVVHLAEGYHMATARDREGRLRQALERMGISVFSGACTTLGASAFMLFAQIQFFYQFGIFMFCTIGFSLLFSLGLYVVIMGLLGPQDNMADIRVPLRAGCAALSSCARRLRHCFRQTKSRRKSEQLIVDDDVILIT